MSLAAALLSLVAAFPLPGAPELHGQYLEARTADVFGGPCTAVAGQPGLDGVDAAAGGREAILAWQVEKGSWDGVDLAGLSVVVVLRGQAPLRAGALAAGQSLIVVDGDADGDERAALEALARTAAGHLLGEVVAVDAAPIQLAVDPARSLARLRVGQIAELATRPFNRLDRLCGDERVSSPPLVPGVAATPAVTLEHTFHGDGLGEAWQAVNRHGAFVGTFDL
jgi:hypothetical protein